MNGSNTHNICHLCTSHVIEMFVKVEEYAGPPLLLFGIVSNILAFLTLRQPKLKESPFIHLMGLTIADLFALVIILLNLYSKQEEIPWNIFTCYVYYPLTNIAYFICVWIMVVMTLERCIFMQFPLWAPIWCTNSSAKFKIVIIVCISFVVNAPRFFWYKPNMKILNSRNFSINDSLIINHINGSYVTKILSWIYSCIHNFLPVSILLVLNSFLIYKIRAQQKRRIQLRIHNVLNLGRTQEQTRLTVTLIAITGIYILLVLPSAFADRNIADILFYNMYNEMVLFQHVSNFLAWLNLSFNFLMYTFVNVKFMKAFKKMLGRWFSPVCRRFLSFSSTEPRIYKTNSSKTPNGGWRSNEMMRSRHPGHESGRRTCSSRLTTSRGFLS